MSVLFFGDLLNFSKALVPVEVQVVIKSAANKVDCRRISRPTGGRHGPVALRTRPRAAIGRGAGLAKAVLWLCRSDSVAFHQGYSGSPSHPLSRPMTTINAHALFTTSNNMFYYSLLLFFGLLFFVKSCLAVRIIRPGGPK